MFLTCVARVRKVCPCPSGPAQSRAAPSSTQVCFRFLAEASSTHVPAGGVPSTSHGVDIIMLGKGLCQLVALSDDVHDAPRNIRGFDDLIQDRWRQADATATARQLPDFPSRWPAGQARRSAKKRSRHRTGDAHHADRFIHRERDMRRFLFDARHRQTCPTAPHTRRSGGSRSQLRPSPQFGSARNSSAFR